MLRHRLLGLGRGEDLRSVRWFDRLAVLVTFRQTDPVHTVDLSDPERPRSLGQLEVPGFSSYLHPIGDDRLLGLGTEADADGTVRIATEQGGAFGDVEHGAFGGAKGFVAKLCIADLRGLDGEEELDGDVIVVPERGLFD